MFLIYRHGDPDIPPRGIEIYDDKRMHSSVVYERLKKKISVSNGPRGHRGRLERGHGISLALLQTRHHLNPALCHALHSSRSRKYSYPWTVAGPFRR